MNALEITIGYWMGPMNGMDERQKRLEKQREQRERALESRKKVRERLEAARLEAARRGENVGKENIGNEIESDTSKLGDGGANDNRETGDTECAVVGLELLKRSAEI